MAVHRLARGAPVGGLDALGVARGRTGVERLLGGQGSGGVAEARVVAGGLARRATRQRGRGGDDSGRAEAARQELTQCSGVCHFFSIVVVSKPPPTGGTGAAGTVGTVGAAGAAGAAGAGALSAGVPCLACLELI